MFFYFWLCFLLQQIHKQVFTILDVNRNGVLEKEEVVGGIIDSQRVRSIIESNPVLRPMAMPRFWQTALDRMQAEQEAHKITPGLTLDEFELFFIALGHEDVLNQAFEMLGGHDDTPVMKRRLLDGLESSQAVRSLLIRAGGAGARAKTLSPLLQTGRYADMMRKADTANSEAMTRREWLAFALSVVGLAHADGTIEAASAEAHREEQEAQAAAAAAAEAERLRIIQQQQQQQQQQNGREAGDDDSIGDDGDEDFVMPQGLEQDSWVSADEAAAGEREEQLYEVSFGDGPLGLALGQVAHGVVVLRVRGNADGGSPTTSPTLASMMQIGDRVEGLDGEDIRHLRVEEVSEAIRRAKRPLTLTFAREAPLQ